MSKKTQKKKGAKRNVCVCVCRSGSLHEELMRVKRNKKAAMVDAVQALIQRETDGLSGNRAVR